MPRTAALQLNLHPNLQTAFAKLYPTAESFLAAQEILSVPEDTAERQFSQQAEEVLLDHIKLHLAPQPVNGLSLLEDVSNHCRTLTTGCRSLDGLLSSGLREGHMTEFAGSPATGKTQVCLQLVAATAWRGEKVIYIDTGQGFSTARILALAKAIAPNFNEVPESLTHFLSLVELFECHTHQELVSILGLLQQKLLVCKGTARRSVLIVDSISALIPATLGLRNTMQGHCLMIQASILLKQLADRYRLAVVVTNSLVAGQTESFKPAMGESWRNQPHTRVILSRQDKGSAEPERRATLALTQVEPANTHAIFTITNQGVVGISADEGTAGV